VQSSVNLVTYGYGGYDFGFAEMSVDGSVLFGENTDITMGIELAKYIYLWSDRLLITPSAYIMAGTQQYYSEYYMTRGPGGAGRGRGSGRDNSGSAVVNSASEFEWLAFEISIPVGLRLGNARLFLYPTYAIPMNLPEMTVEGVTTIPKLENSLFWTAGIRYAFY
jgi:hypothetical protein